MTVAPFLVGLGALGVLYPLLARSPRAGVLGWIGVHSYAVYLVHQKVIDKLVAGHAAVTGGVLLRILAAAALSVVLGVGLEWILVRLGKMIRRSPEGKTVTPPAG